MRKLVTSKRQTVRDESYRKPQIWSILAVVILTPLITIKRLLLQFAYISFSLSILTTFQSILWFCKNIMKSNMTDRRRRLAGNNDAILRSDVLI